MRLQLVLDANTETSTPDQPFCKQHRKIVASLPPIKTHLPTSNLLPALHFHGSSRANSGATTYPSSSPSSFVRGVVQLTADSPPQVRWTLVIRYAGEDRWRLEAVQVGGRGSKRGFFGVSSWFWFPFRRPKTIWGMRERSTE